MNDRGGPSTSSLAKHPHLVPMVCLAGVVLLFSTVAPATKYVFQISQLDPNILACARVGIGFLFLLPATLVSDSRGLASLTWRHMVRLTALGWLGVVSYAVAAWGLQYTTVSHYILIYSLIPTFTTIFGICLGSHVLRPLTVVGVVCASLGCVIAISDNSMSADWTFNFGDACALLYTVMMAAHMAWSGGIAKQFGVLTANTVMFGMSFLVLLLVALVSGKQPGTMSFALIGMVVYIGLATVGAFMLRYRCLRSLAPATVATYHNLIPICTILLAHLSLDEPIDSHLVLGGLTILMGIELVRGNYELGPGWARWVLSFKQKVSAVR
ncbi:MAG: DMT family transporter [Nitrospiraceae bacterium]